MSDDLFTLDVVRDFIASKGGKVPNHVLVTHFKSFLNDPRSKGANRDKFKQFVNTLASVKLDESGEKLLVLKKKYRDDYVQPQQDVQEKKPYKIEAPRAKLKDAFPLRQPSEDPAAAESLGLDDFALPQEPEESSEDSLLAAITKELGLKKAAVETPPPHPEIDEDFQSVSEGPSSSDLATPSSAASGNEEVFEDALQDLPSKQDALTKFTEPEPVFSEPAPLFTEPEPVFTPTPVFTEPEPAFTEPKLAPVQSLPNLSENKPEELPSKSASAAATREQTPESELENSKNETSSRETSLEPVIEATQVEDVNATVLSVKDRAKHLNKISSASQLPHILPAKKSSKRQKDDTSSDASSLMINLDEDERQWMLASCKADYQEMNKLLNKRPDLAPKKDFITGFTALHWASKKGNCDVVKLLCGNNMVNINAKSNGGYTPLHLAAMQGHEGVIELLVQVYGADTNIRDHSGKRAKQYLQQSVSSRAQQLLQSSRLSHVSSHSGISKQSIGSKVKAIGAGFNPTSLLKNSWSSGSGDRGGSSQRSLTPSSPSPSPQASPSLSRKVSAVSAPGDTDLMPPPSEAPPRKNKRNKRAVKSDMGGSQEMIRSGSDTILNRASTPERTTVHSSVSYTSMV